MNIHAGDHVVVITGKDKGKTGAVLQTLAATGRVVVASINMRTKHVKATPQQAGQRLQYEASIDASNVMLIDPKTKKRTRVGYSVTDKGKKERIAKKSGEAIARVAKTAPAKNMKDIKKEEKKAKPVSHGKGNVERAEKPGKKPFWKKIGFGASEVEETGAEDEKNSSKKGNQSRSVPEQGKTPDVLSHQRGK